jgi:hypothetical protein
MRDSEPGPPTSEPVDGLRHVDGVSAKPVHLRHDETIIWFKAVNQLQKAGPFLGGRATWDDLLDDPAFIDREARGLAFIDLVLPGLTGGRDPCTSEITCDGGHSGSELFPFISRCSK